MFRTSLIIAGVLVTSSTAFAHITIATGPVAAGKSAKIGLAINHGCASSTQDSFKIRVDLPAGFSNVRALRSDFGSYTLIKNGADVVAIEWTKPVTDKRAADDSYYELTFKATVPNTPYKKLALNITQTCTDALGVEQAPVHWDGTNPAEPAPSLVIAPARTNATGWNKFTIPASTTVAAADFGAYFGDALIVWKGTAAYSANPNTLEQITATTGVTALTGELAAGDVIWVRY